MTGVFMTILGMSATACVIIAAVLLLRLMLRKAPKVFSYVLWAAVFFRLLCPFTFELPAPVGVTPVQVQTRDVGEFIEPSSVQFTISETRLPVPAVKREEASVIFVTAEKERGEDLVYTKNKNALDIIAIVWAAGAGAMALYGVVSFVRLRMRLKGAHREDGYYVCGSITNPFIFGLFRPKIYIPDGLTDEQRGFILLHERAHIRRFDHAAKIVMYIALCLHWFDPLVWLSFRLCEKDMEMSTDQRVTADMQPDRRAEYSQTLLSVTAAKTAAFTACFGESNIKQRVKNVLYYKRPALWIIVVCVVGIVIAMVLMMTNTSSAKENEPESEPAAVTEETEPSVTAPPVTQEQQSALFLTESDKKALDLFGEFNIYADEEGMVHIREDALTVSHDYDLFRKYFFGTWAGSNYNLTIDDSELSANSLSSTFVDFYTVGDKALAYIITGNAGGTIYWLDKNEPDMLYAAGGMPGGSPNFIGYNYRAERVLTWSYKKTDAPVNEPQNGYMSKLRIREIADKYGFEPTLITDFGAVTESGTRYHDDQYNFYPMYLIKEDGEKEPKTLIFRTSVGDPYITGPRPGVTVTLEGYYGKWHRTVVLAGEDVPPDDTLTGRELAEMEAVDNAIAALIQTDEFRALPLDEKREKANTLLIQLATVGTPEFPYSLIYERTILYSDEGNKKLRFAYICGAGGAVVLEDHGSELQGSAAQTAAPETTAPETTPTETTAPETIPVQSPQHPEFSVITAPPRMTVIFGSNESVQVGAVMGAYSWSYKDGNNWIDTEAESLHPLDPDFGAEQLPATDIRLSQSKFVALAFGRAPTGFPTTRCWSIDSIGNTAEKGVNGGLSGQNASSYVFFYPPDKEGDYICRITAEWDVPEKYKGRVEYVIRVNVIDDREPAPAEQGSDDHPASAIKTGKIVYKGQDYSVFPDRPLYALIDGVYYYVNELVFEALLPEHLNEEQLIRSDAVADIVSRRSIGTPKYAEEPRNDLETDQKGIDGYRMYWFEDGYTFGGADYEMFGITDNPVYYIDGIPIYQFIALQKQRNKLDHTQTADKAAELYLRGNKAALEKYLADPNYETGIGEDIFDKLESFTLYHSDWQSSAIYFAIYQCLLKNSDMYIYLDMQLKKYSSGWKVEQIYMQG